ncbi:MAG: peptidylprolyl isomerase [Casimicrobiaceae bacterium]|nr:peptidylprolyl isomerase [Casimicrobiaceae bacterium]MCX8097480.1 peptidylprolyl isomerase [Casimicrobiaceae bacterium]MDW8311198.1 peptidylprolyl isomerase [Burkholderiales bacterium]
MKQTHICFRAMVLSTVALVCAWGASAPVCAQAGAAASRLQLLDRIVAIVNDEVITRYELDQQRRAVLTQLARQGIPAPPAAELDAQVLERFINEKVQLQYARETGIRADEETVNAALQRIAADNGMSMQQFIQALRNDGLTLERFRSELANEIVLTRLREREIESRVTVSEAEIEAELARLRAAGRGVEYQLAHVLILVPEQASPEQIALRRQRAEEALRQLNAGTPFGQVAAVFSDAADAVQGGNLGWREADRLPALYAETAAKLSVGATSEVLRSANGFHIVRLLNKRDKTERVVVEQHRTRHILARVNDLVSESEARDKIERALARIRAGTRFEEVARTMSEDASAARGGDLGWVAPGDTVPEFEAAVKNAKIGEVTGPVRTPFGWHLIEVVERRMQDVTAERTRAQARQAVRDRKAEEAYQSWLRELRDRATVEIKLNEG